LELLKVKIALIYSHALNPGGYPRDIRWLSTALAAGGAEVMLLSEPGDETDGLDDRVTLAEMSAVHRLKDQIDLIHVFGILLPKQMMLIRRLRGCGKPVVLSPLGHLMPHGFAVRKLRKVLYIRAIAPWLKDVWFHTFGPAEDAGLDNHFPAWPRFHASAGVYPRPPGACQHDARQASPGLKLLYLGRNDVYQKGIDLLLEAVSAAVAKGSDCHLTIAGRPWAGSQKYIMDTIVKSNLQNRVLIAGRVDEVDKWRLFAQADYLVFLSRWDGPPRPVREAISASLPVVVSPETNLGHLVEEHNAGLQVGLEPAPIAHALQRLASNPGLRPAFVRGASALRERLQWSRLARDYQDGYKQVLGAYSQI
jgi:glycosyltransferase involved in cell wall biosynthesis